MTGSLRVRSSTESTGDSEGVRRRAAEYVRMSTDHQRYSTENQSAAIRKYAEERGIEIVRTYADHGKSGLSLAGRSGLKSLIDDVRAGRADFDLILVYDVSRWGRFQDADESAFYEYQCRKAGIQVEYCIDGFENDGSPVATIVKGVKRALAGEGSRLLSVRVFAGQGRLIELGFRQGGPAGFGLRRHLLDGAGNRKASLARGEHKSLQTDRVILVPGPPEEVDAVRWIYRSFVEEGRRENEIAALLNAQGISTDLGRPWTRGTVHQILINEKYVGDNVWNRISCKLQGARVRNRPDMWIRRDGAFEPLVDRMLFEAAQIIIRERSRRLTDEEMLEVLRSITTCTASGAAARSTVDALTFRAVTRTLLFDHTWESSTKAMLLLSSEASAKSPRRAPGTVTSTLAVAPGPRLGRSQLVSSASVRVPTGSDGQP